MNYFELFELPVSINIDKSCIAKKYFELQKLHHPDFFTQADETEQQAALEKSSTLNKALKTLKNQDETIRYVLELKGLIEPEEKYTLAPDFLMEMMELNENFGDDTAAKIEAAEQDLLDKINPIVVNYDDATITKEELLQLKEYYFKKKYLHRILDRMEG